MSSVNWPSNLTPAEIELGLKFNTQVSVSDLSGYVQTVELPGARWSMSLRMPPLERNGESSVMEAFIAKLRGQAVRAVMPVFNRSTVLGLWEGTPAVNNEVGSPTLSQTGTTLQCRDFTPFTTVKAGDYFNLGSAGQLLMVTEDGMADSNGLLQLSVQPAIRSAPSHLTVLDFTSPVVPLMILTDPHPRWRIKPADITEFALDFIEVFG
jgi:hypothetical protein